MASQVALPLQAADPPRLPVDTNYGAVFTRRWVVELILDLCGYTPEQDLSEKLLVEPACGDGAFLGLITERLIESCARHDRDPLEAIDSVRAFDLQRIHVERSRDLVAMQFVSAGLSGARARKVAEAWVAHGDFLLTRLLVKEGVLGFICADRWMRNAYGKRVRRMIVDGYAVDTVIEMHDVDAFTDDVAAYPAVVVLRHGQQHEPLMVTTQGGFDATAATALLEWAASNPASGQAQSSDRWSGARLPAWFDTDTSWPTGSPRRLALLRTAAPRSSDGLAARCGASRTDGPLWSSWGNDWGNHRTISDVRELGARLPRITGNSPVMIVESPQV